MATVYYNFDSVMLNLGGTEPNRKAQSISAIQPNPTTNIQYNNTPYFMNNVYFCKDTSEQKTYFVVKSTADPDADGKCIYFAIPVVSNTDPTAEPTEIDKIFQGVKPVTVNLSGFLTDGDPAKIYVASNEWPTVIVGMEYAVKSNFTDITVMKADTIEHLTLSGTNSTPATIRKHIFDWNMNCTLVGEDEAGGEVNVPTVRVDTMDTIALLVMLLLVVSSFYLSVPIIYKYYIVPIAKSGRKDLPLASIDMYWTAITVLIIISFAVFGIKSKQPSYYFFAFTVGLILFISKKWVRENIGNIYSDNKAGINVDFTADSATSNTPKGIDTGYFSVFTTDSGGMNYKAIIAVFITLSAYLGINISSAVSETTDSKFSSAIISFMGLSIFTTAMFMAQIKWKILFFGIFIAVVTTTPMLIFNVMDLITSKISK